MKISLKENIYKITDNSSEQVLAVFKKSENASEDVLSWLNHSKKENIISIKALINPPSGFADAFKSRMSGQIIDRENQTIIDLKIRPSWVIIIFSIIWISLLLIMFYQVDLPNISKTVKFIGFFILYLSIPLGLGKLKVNWDRRRLEKWINSKFRV